MLCIHNGFEFQGLCYYQNPDQPLAYYYIPGDPQPQRDAAGTPMVTVVAAGPEGFLQLSVTWDAAPDTLEALRHEIVSRQALKNPAVVRLAFAPVTVHGVFLMLGDGSGNFSDLQQRASSGFPPYATVFSLQLTPEQHAQVIAALNGREGFLRLRYEAALQASIEVTGKLSGDVARLAAQLQESPADVTLAGVEALLQQAMEDGSLQLTVEAPENSPISLVERTQQLVLTQAAARLLHCLQGEASLPDTSHLEVTAALREPLMLPLEAQTDVATWFDGGSGTAHLQVTASADSTPGRSGQPVDTAQPASGRLTVRLGFPPADAPLALLCIRRGPSQAMRSPPDFAPMELPAGSPGEPVTVETSYTTGSPVYQVSLPAQAAELILMPGDLGMVQVTVDARPLQAAGAKRARLWLRYQPEDQGVADERTMHFRNREWQASWFLITRSATLQGSLTYEWQVTTASGKQVKHKMAQAAVPQIVLSLGSREV
jgi:hypothetical protein